MQALAQVDGRIVDAQLVCLRPEVEGVARAATLEAVEAVLLQVGREAATGRRGRAV